MVKKKEEVNHTFTNRYSCVYIPFTDVLLIQLCVYPEVCAASSWFLQCISFRAICCGCCSLNRWSNRVSLSGVGSRVIDCTKCMSRTNVPFGSLIRCKASVTDEGVGEVCS